MMTDNFDESNVKPLSRLACELSMEERHELLKKLRGQTTLSSEPLYQTDAASRKEGIAAQFSNLSWYYRLYCFLLGLFKGKKPEKAFEDKQIEKMGRTIQNAAPGLYDYRQNRLSFKFFTLLEKLKDSARFFFRALDTGIGRDKGAFYAFLASLEMEEIHIRLQMETDPSAIMEKFPNITESEMRQMALRAMEDAFTSISDNHRNVMYNNTRSLNCLKALSSFSFDRILLAFSRGEGRQNCPVNMIYDLLITLNNVLYSLREPPAFSLLESLFVFPLNERAGGKKIDINREMRLFLSEAENAITTIRDFNKRIPLTSILRCASRDMTIVPRQISGGEDWFQTYREYWRRKVESSIADYILRHKHQEISASFTDFFRGSSLKIMANAASEKNRNGFPLPQSLALAFLQTFHAAVYLPSFNQLLRTILIEGEFFKQENRTEFAEAYNDINNIENDIHKLDLNIAPGGDYGKRYSQELKSSVSLSLKQRRIQSVLDKASHDAREIAGRCRKAVEIVIHNLTSIIRKEPVGKYNGISNFDKLAGFATEEYTKNITDILTSFQYVLETLQTIDTLGSPPRL